MKETNVCWEEKRFFLRPKKKIFILIFIFAAKINCEKSKENLLSSHLDRIIGGRAIEIEKNPWQVSLQLNQVHRCGGSIISDKFILTAAHCFLNYGDQLKNDTKFYQILSGSNVSYHEVNSTSKYHQIRNIFVHEDYNKTTFKNDIALIEVEDEINFNNATKAIKLQKSGKELDFEDLVYVSGYGKTEERGSISTKLMKVNLMVYKISVCANQNKANKIGEEQICAGDVNGKKDSCQGDSGGALIFYSEDEHPIQVGIVSFGIGCARAGFPGIYTKVSYYRDWIKGIAKL